MCPDCRAPHKYYHVLTFRSISALEEHLRLLTLREEKIQSIVTWWKETRDLYKDTVSDITGAPLSVAEAWRDAQIAAESSRETTSATARAAEARVQGFVDDLALSDKEVMQAALTEIDRLVNKMPTWPEPPPKPSAAAIQAYIAGKGE